MIRTEAELVEFFSLTDVNCVSLADYYIMVLYFVIVNGNGFNVKVNMSKRKEKNAENNYNSIKTKAFVNGKEMTEKRRLGNEKMSMTSRGLGKRKMLFGHWFPPHAIRSVELGTWCILSMLKLKQIILLNI